MKISCGTLVVLLGCVCVWKIYFVSTQYTRNTELLNIGWIWSVPYDIGNTLRAPLGGPLSIILTSGLAVVMLFGLAVSPVYYLLGTPSRKYHVHDAIQTIPKSGRSFDSPFDLSHLNDTINSFLGSGGEQVLTSSQSQPDDSQSNLMESYFLFLNEDDENCRKLLICHAHGFLTYIPVYFLPIYRFFSKNIMLMPRDYQQAIRIGFEDQGSCVKTFTNCTKDLLTIVQQTVLGLFLPQHLI